MTTKLVLEPLWTGETVAVLGNAPSLDDELASLPRPMHAIAANQAAIKAPWADMMVSIDANWRPELDDFAGVRIIGFESDDIDGSFYHIPHEVVEVGPANFLHLRSNLISAIRIAAAMGAAKIIVLGIDPDYYEANHAAPGSAAGIAAVMAELNNRGIVVERYAPPETSAPDVSMVAEDSQGRRKAR